jgi:hypothetical protein
MPQGVDSVQILVLGAGGSEGSKGSIPRLWGLTPHQQSYFSVAACFQETWPFPSNSWTATHIGDQRPFPNSWDHSQVPPFPVLGGILMSTV